MMQMHQKQTDILQCRHENSRFLEYVNFISVSYIYLHVMLFKLFYVLSADFIIMKMVSHLYQNCLLKTTALHALLMLRGFICETDSLKLHVLCHNLLHSHISKIYYLSF